MKTTDFVFPRDGEVPYTTPELTVVRIQVEQGFVNSFNSDDMEVQPEEEW